MPLLFGLSLMMILSIASSRRQGGKGPFPDGNQLQSSVQPVVQGKQKALLALYQQKNMLQLRGPRSGIIYKK
jgi:hypothetical protein